MFELKRSTDSTATLNLKRLLLLRSIAIVCELLVLAVAIRVLHMDLPVTAMLTVIILHTIINILAWARPGFRHPVSVPEFALQLALDTVVLAALLYFSGGYTNPFVSLFLLPLVIAASILPKVYTWIMAVLTVGCYSALIFFYRPLPMAQITSSGSEFGLHVLGMWFSFLLSAGLVVFFVVRMATSLRERDRALAQVRERALHDQHLVALGTLATGAAHELGTPLATMAVLAHELRIEHANDPEVVEKADIFRSQIERCKTIISDISASTGQARGEGGCGVAVDDYLHAVLDQWQALSPRTPVMLDMHGPNPAPYILADKTLTQAIINILNNAAEVALDQIEIEARWDVEQMQIAVRDDGPGFSDAVLGNAGTPFFTTKKDGHGLGLFLARAVLERFHGSLEVSNCSGRGAQVRMRLPLSALEVGA